MNKKHSNLILILIIFFAALSLRTIYLSVIIDAGSPITEELADQKLYDSLAVSLWKNHEFSVFPGFPVG